VLHDEAYEQKIEVMNCIKLIIISYCYSHVQNHP